MSGLVGYASSDEEGSGEHLLVEETTKVEANDLTAPKVQSAVTNGVVKRDSKAELSHAHASPQPQLSANEPTETNILGPRIEGPQLDGRASPNPSASPYTANRSTIRSLTLPPKMNLDIPPSPPSSPPPSNDAKIRQFLDLKKRGIHFNSKLAASSALKNPSLLPKLMGSFGLTAETDQYVTTLPNELWSPNGFPNQAYKEELAKTQQEITKRKETERRGAERDFVPASQDKKGGGESQSKDLSAAERVMAGLERRGPREPGRSPKRRRRSRSK